MDPTIRQIEVKRFRSLPAETVVFDNPTFLVGRNGSGKSNFVDVFAFLAEAMAAPLQSVFDRRGGISAVRNLSSGAVGYPPNLGLGVVLGPLNGEVTSARYAFEIRALKNHGFEVVREQCVVRGRDQKRHYFDRRKDRFASSVTGLNLAFDPSSLALPSIGGEARFAPVLRTLTSFRVYSIEPSKLREMQDPDSGVILRSDGSNAASVLQEIERKSSDDIEIIGDFLAKIVPNTRRVKAVKRGNKVALQFTQEWAEKRKLRFESFNMSDGTLRAFGLLAAIYQYPTPSVIVIEEPEATIHPGALGAILDLIKAASKKTQVVITTHSPDLLDGDWIREKHLRIVDWQEGATRIAHLAEDSKKVLNEHLMGAGELLRSNALKPSTLFVDPPGQMNFFEDF